MGLNPAVHSSKARTRPNEPNESNGAHAGVKIQGCTIQIDDSAMHAVWTVCLCKRGEYRLHNRRSASFLPRQITMECD